MLELAPFPPRFLTVTETKDLLNVIQERAILQWGEKKWRAELARATVEIMKQSDPTATYMNRRRQIYRVFEEYACTTDTLMALVKAVGCRLQLVCIETKVIDI